MPRTKCNYVVKYDNEMNKVEIGKLSIREAQLFAAICAYVKNKGTEVVRMPFDKIRKLSGYSDRDNGRLIAELKSLNRKLLSLYYEFEDERRVQGFNLFQWWEIRKDEQIFEIAVSQKFEWMLNQLGAKFTRFELDDYTTLDSKYSASLYRLLKQYRSTGLFCITLIDFRRLMDVPKSASERASILDKIVLTPAINELRGYFDDLTVTKTFRNGIGRGGKVLTGFEFRFRPEITHDDEHDDEKATQQTIDGLKRTIAETELKILSTKRAMEKADAAGDWKKYETHKQNNQWMIEKLEKLNRNLSEFFKDPEQLIMPVLAPETTDIAHEYHPELAARALKTLEDNGARGRAN